MNRIWLNWPLQLVTSHNHLTPYLHKTMEGPIATPHNHSIPQLCKTMKGATTTPNNHSTPQLHKAIIPPNSEPHMIYWLLTWMSGIVKYWKTYLTMAISLTMIKSGPLGMVILTQWSLWQITCFSLLPSSHPACPFQPHSMDTILMVSLPLTNSSFPTMFPAACPIRHPSTNTILMVSLPLTNNPLLTMFPAACPCYNWVMLHTFIKTFLAINYKWVHLLDPNAPAITPLHYPP